MKSFLSLSTYSFARVFHFRPLMAKLQCRTFQNYPAFHLPIGTTCRNYMQCSQIKLKKDRLSSIISINHSQSLTNGGSMSPATNYHSSPGSLLNYWSFNNGNILTSLESGVFVKRLFSTSLRVSSSKNQNVGGFSKHWKKPKALGAAHDKDETNTNSRISASKDVDAVTSTETAVGDAKLGSAVSRTRNKKSKVNETEKKESKSKKNKGQASSNAVSEKAAGAKSMTTTSPLKKSLGSKSGQTAARASQKKITEEMPNEVHNGSTKQQSNKKNGNSSKKRTTKKAVNGSAEKQKPQKIGKLQPFAQGKLKSLYPSTEKCVVVVESVTKAKVIQGYLGDMYEVLPSYGHVRDLAARSGSVRPDDDFSIVWEVPSAAWTHLNSIKVAISGAKNLILASDPDREGEAIAWHIVEMLQQQDALRQDLMVARVVFHEITETSIKNALQAPRGIDVNLVHAYLARRALDYLIGFNISPLLWRKLPGCQSAGRVQSAALSLLCDREMEIDEFKPQEYWTIGATLKKQEQDSLVNAHLTHFDSKKLNQFSISSDTEAKNMEQKINSANFQVVGSRKTKTHRNPPTPYITSTLQQDAANKLDFATSYTMKVAQKLYEGVQLSDGKATGLITYLRTDGLHISDEAVGNIRSLIIERYGQDFASKGPRKYFRKVKNAQEAHEAIRPTNIQILPSMLVGVLDEDSLKLYTLIWSRTVACQMEPVTIELVQVDIGNAGKSIVFRSSCSRVEFPGYQAVYEDVKAGAVRYNKESDALDRQEAFGILDSLKTGDSLYLGEADMKQHFTEPSPRYSEGSLVKKLEELGIGRPSTYASTLKVLKDRNYMTVKNRALHPEFRGRMVSAFLSHHFTEVTDYSFTADMENELDNVSAGLTEWKGLLRDYWTRFQSYCSRTESVHIHQVEKMLEKTYERFLFGSLPDKSRTCPSCMEGTLIFKVSRFGAGYFIGCDQHPNCKYIAKTLYGDDEKEETPQSSSVDEPKLLGVHPTSNEKVLLKNGPYGYYVQLGEDRKGSAPKRSSVSHIKDVDAITNEVALNLLRYPLTLGDHPKDGYPVMIKLGKGGYTVKHRRTMASVPKNLKPEKITMEKALELLSGKNVSHSGRPKSKPKVEEAVEAT
ncbi:DNA topoisomerase [Salix suchowensis]|nr:DNA topoisomerase [Salix suchowensis]